MLHPSRIFIAIMIIILSFLALYAYKNQTKYKNITAKDGFYLVVEEPSESHGTQKVILKSEVKNGPLVEGRTRPFPRYQIGEELYIKGSFNDISDDNPSRNFYILKGISATVAFPEISNRHRAGWSFKSALPLIRLGLIAFRQKLTAGTTRLLPEPQAGLMNGIVFGERSGFNDNLSGAFSRAGLTHIVALSGYNITIVIAFLSFIINKGNRRLYLLICVAGITFFVLATGLSSSVIRAAIMGSVFLLAGFWGRRPDGIVAILFAAVVMAIINPYILLYDIGFWLSFAAMLGMILLAPALEAKLKFLGHAISTVIAGTLAAQLFTWPIISTHFGIVSLVAPLSNLLVLPIIPFVMLVGFGGAFLGACVENLPALASFLPWLASSYIIKISEVLSRPHYAALPLKVSSGSVILGYYLLLGELVIILRKGRNA